jgi:AmpD protein
LPELIVVHCIALPPGEFGGPWIDQLFCNCLDPAEHHYFAEIHGLKVSAHFLIDREGSLTQYVPVNQRAWHAGESVYAGRPACNDFSVGIELEGDEIRDYTAVQYKVLAAVIDTLRASVDSLRDAPVVGHSDIAPGRKTDPGAAFDWTRLSDLLAVPALPSDSA